MKKLLFLLFVFSLLVLTGCSKSVSELTSSDDYLGKRVSVKGTVESPLKIGNLSGYTLVDSNGDKLLVASSRLPDAGDTVTARGVLKNGVLGLGFYLDTN